MRALRYSALYKNRTFHSVGKILCVSFQGYVLKFHTPPNSQQRRQQGIKIVCVVTSEIFVGMARKHGEGGWNPMGTDLNASNRQSPPGASLVKWEGSEQPPTPVVRLATDCPGNGPLCVSESGRNWPVPGRWWHVYGVCARRLGGSGALYIKMVIT